jgi:hypothetical protein
MMDPWIPPETSILSRIKSKEIMGDIKDSAKAKWYSLIGYGERKIRKKEGLQNFDREVPHKSIIFFTCSKNRHLPKKQRKFTH